MIYQYSQNIFKMDIMYYTLCEHVTDLSIGFYKHQLACSTQSFIAVNSIY